MVVLVSSLFLGGCWDRQEVNDVAFVLASAVDREKGKYHITVQFTLPGKMGGGKTKPTNESAMHVESASGESVRITLESLQKGVSRELNFSHRRVLVVSEAAAKAGLQPIMDIVARIPQNRITTQIIIADGKAADLLKQQVDVEKTSADMIRELLVASMRKPFTVKDVIDSYLTEGKNMTIPVMTPSGEEGPSRNVRISGLALFEKDKLAGIAKDEEARGLMLALNLSKAPLVLVKSPEIQGALTVALKQSQVDIKPEMKDGEISFIVRLQTSGMLVENGSSYEASSDNGLLIERLVRDKLQSMVESSLQALQQKYKVDTLSFGHVLRRNMPAEWAKVKKDWNSLFPNVGIKVSADFKLEDTGAIVRPLLKEEEIESR